MSREILINVGAGETRIAIAHDGRLEEFYLERTLSPDDMEAARRRRGRGGHSVVGNIMLGRVQRVLPGMQAAFVEVGLDRAGFLGAREARCLIDLPGFQDDEQPCISEMVREGQTLLVQAIKDPIGDKGARLSANITIPGRMLVLVPNQRGVALSRRITDEAERARLSDLVGAMADGRGGRTVEDAGYIVRTVAIGAGEAELLEDATRLAEEWGRIAAKAKTASAPATVYLDLDPVQRTIRDGLDAETVRVLIDDPHAAAEARAYAETAAPEVAGRIELFSGPGFLFDLYGIEGELSALLDQRVALPSGGWIMIEQTEALTSIDVNSGRYTAATGLEETSLRINLEAAGEIGRQVRLRGIGGVVVIDFIHLENPENVAQVLSVLEASLARDRVPTQILPMSEFGLVEMTRKRVRDPLVRLLTDECNSCRGRGRFKTVPTMANELLRRAEREARARPGRPLALHAAPEVIQWLEAHDETVMETMRRRTGAALRLVPRTDFPREAIDVGPG